jgi:hypothetical protein
MRAVASTDSTYTTSCSTLWLLIELATDRIVWNHARESGGKKKRSNDEAEKRAQT